MVDKKPYTTYLVSLAAAIDLAEAHLRQIVREYRAAAEALLDAHYLYVIDHAQYLIQPQHGLGEPIQNVLRTHLPTEMSELLADRIHDQVLQDLRDVLRQRFDFSDVVYVRPMGREDLLVTLDMESIEQGDYYDSRDQYTVLRDGGHAPGIDFSDPALHKLFSR
mgnify:CR=1 FL=1